MEISIDINTLLTFFDEVPTESVEHATAICQVAGEDLGFGLLTHYFKSKGKQVRLVSRKCNHGTNAGHRLDGWLRVDDAKSILYQVEVKNWSAHATDGKCLLVKARKADVSKHKIEAWEGEWSKSKGKFTKPQVQKVLERMKPPQDAPYDSIEPLVCYWNAMHPKGKLSPFFQQPLRGKDFSVVNVFSMSSYLRILNKEGKRRLKLEMPDTVRRVDWLHRMFPLLKP